MAGQQVDRLAEPRNADVACRCDRDSHGDSVARQRHFQGVAIDAGDALQVRIVQQHGLAVDRQLDVETEMARAEL